MVTKILLYRNQGREYCLSTITYKCPNCPSSLRLEPKTQMFTCDYCGSAFTHDELKKRQSETSAPEPDFAKTARLYHCQSCGAEVFTDDTTAATLCIYCHNPIVLSQELSGDFKPDQVIPFKIPKEQVTKALMEWCKKKRFIDNAFFDKAQVAKLSGVYFPYFIVDGKSRFNIRKKGTKVKTWQQGNYRYTQTDTYRVEREGEMAFNDIPITALHKDHTYILNGIQPFDQQKAVPFSMPYLSGFLADKRNITTTDAMPEAGQIAEQSTRASVNDTIAGYTTLLPEQDEVTITQTDFSYVLMPSWMMTYQYGKEPFYFAMNADSGKIAGRVPLSKRKLRVFSITIAALVTTMMMLAGWII